MMEIIDQPQRQQALIISQSFIVQAPAGSGKTELLTQRLLTALTQVEQPENILAITFTNKAANEMRNRIVEALHLAQVEQPEDTHKQQTWRLAQQVFAHSQQQQWDLLNNPNRLRIQTIDSLCASLIKQMPMQSHIGSAADITTEADELYEKTVDIVLSQLEEDLPWADPIATLLKHLDNDLSSVKTLLMDMLRFRDQWLPHVLAARNNQDLRQHCEAALHDIVISALQHAHDLFSPARANTFIPLLRFAADNLRGSTSSLSFCLDIVDLPAIDLTAIEQWQAIAQLLLTKEFEWRKRLDKNIGFPTDADNKADKQRYKEYKTQMQQFLLDLNTDEALRLALEEIISLPPVNYSENQWQILQALLNLLPILAAQLHLVFQQSGTIDFIELNQRALQALGTDQQPTDLALHLDYKIQHILVDEFQDTSISQFRLLERLTAGWQPDDGRSLFVVGDPMQSIYRFRAAEVGLFLRARQQGIGQLQLIPLQLRCNFRSQRYLVEWVNDAFQHIMPKQEDIEQGAVSYNASTAIHPPEARSLYFYQHNQHEKIPQPAYEQDTIVEIIQQQDSHASIAILVKARSQLFEIIPALQAAGLRYQAVEIQTLAHLPYIQDLTNLTYALSYPAHRLAWLSILRAPWCGIELRDLFILAGTSTHTTIWKNITDTTIHAQLSQTGKQRLQHFINALAPILSQRDRFSLHDWVYSAWLRLAGPATLQKPNMLENCHAFFKLLDQLSTIEKLAERLEKLYAKPDTDNQSMIQIMTIHKAKGLEFDCVILPNLNQRPPAEDNKLLLWHERPRATDDAIDLLLAPIKAHQDDEDAIYNYLKLQHRNKATLELDRLFYVAVTRAKKELHLLATVKINPDEPEKFQPHKDSLLNRLWSPYANRFIDKLAKTHTQLLEKPTLQRLTSDYQLPSVFKNLLSATLLAPFNPLSKAKNIAIWQDPTARIIGIVIHYILEQLSHLPFQAWPFYLEKNWAPHLLHQGLQYAQLSFALQQIQLFQRSILNSDKAQWILNFQHELAQTEWGLQTCTQSYIIDRTFVAEGQRWIIDYKTSIPAPRQALNDFLTTERKQYLQQLQQYGEVVKHIDSRPIKYGLYFVLIDAWVEWE